MADAFDVLTDAPAVAEQFTPPRIFNEQQFIIHWTRDTERAASAAASSAGLDPDEACDFSQEAHIRLLAMCRTGRPHPDSYVRIVIANAVRSARRPSLRWLSRYVSPERPRMIAEQEERECESTIDDFAAPEEADPTGILAVRRFISSIPARLFKVYNLLYLEGLTQEEAARRLGVTRQRVTQLHGELLRRGRKHFQCAPQPN